MIRLMGRVILIMMMFTIGVGIGLVITWGVMPVRLVDTAPGTLQKTDKDWYRVLIAEDYLVTADKDRARARLLVLDNNGAWVALSDQVNRRAWNRDVEGDALTKLDSDLSNNVAVIPQPTVNQITPLLSTATNTLSTTLLFTNQVVTPLPIYTLVITSSTTPSPFVLLGSTPACIDGQTPPILEITIVDSLGKPREGIVIVVSSSETTERIITGLKSGIASGVADTIMQPGVKYTITLEGRSSIPEVFMASECRSSSGDTFSGGWSVKIQY
jgi:hypothetical protein